MRQPIDTLHSDAAKDTDRTIQMQIHSEEVLTHRSLAAQSSGGSSDTQTFLFPIANLIDNNVRLYLRHNQNNRLCREALISQSLTRPILTQITTASASLIRGEISKNTTTINFKQELLNKKEILYMAYGIWYTRMSPSTVMQSRKQKSKK